jgi:hypothetical protein
MNALDNDLNLAELLGRRGLFARPEVKRIQTRQDLVDVYKLTHDSYVENNYAPPHASLMLIHYPYFDHLRETEVLIARLRGEIVGTVSYTLDGPSGLTVDEDFRERCNEERASGKRIAAVWRLVVDEKHRNQREIVTALIREVIVGLRENNVRSAFFSVNPRHVNVYKKMLNMEIVAQKEITHGLRNAPAVLLLGDPQNLPARVIEPDPRFAAPIRIPVLLNIYDF